jgi:hypothetical protein
MSNQEESLNNLVNDDNTTVKYVNGVKFEYSEPRINEDGVKEIDVRVTPPMTAKEITINIVPQIDNGITILRKGHKYNLPLFEDNSKSMDIQFIEKECINQETGELKTINDGITNEQLLTVLIDRMNHMQSKFPCRENSIATTHLETALLWLEKRTADRKKRNVEGKHLK